MKLIILYIFAVYIVYYSVKLLTSRVITIDLPGGSRNVPIDGLRGYLAIFVMLHHFTIFHGWFFFDQWVQPGNTFLSNLGRSSVYIFFMITGYLFIGRLIFSINENKKIKWKSIYISRFFRIAPLYLICISVTYLVYFTGKGFLLNDTYINFSKEILKWMLFIGSAIDGDQSARLIHAGVTWTLRYEWIFYLLLPLVYCILKSRLLTLLGFIVTIILFLFPKVVWVFEMKYFILFSIGGLCYLLKNSFVKNSNIFRRRLTSVVLTILYCFSLGFDKSNSGLLVVLSMFLVFLSVSQGNDFFGLLSTSTSRYLGEVSYSIYLSHGIIIYIIFDKVIGLDGFISQSNYYYLSIPIVLLVVLASFVTFKYIELPFIRIGKRLSKKLS